MLKWDSDGVNPGILTEYSTYHYTFTIIHVNKYILDLRISTLLLVNLLMNDIYWPIFFFRIF